MLDPEQAGPTSFDTLALRAISLVRRRTGVVPTKDLAACERRDWSSVSNKEDTNHRLGRGRNLTSHDGSFVDTLSSSSTILKQATLAGLRHEGI